MRKLILLIILAVPTVFIASTVSVKAGTFKSSADFVRKASIANEFEIESSRLALEKSQNPAIKGFAQAMIDDHTKTGNDLKTALVSSSVNPAEATDTLDLKHQKKLEELQNLSGKKFDEKYVDTQKETHKHAVDLFENYSKKGDDVVLKDFAAQTLPTLKGHLKHVKELNS